MVGNTDKLHHPPNPNIWCFYYRRGWASWDVPTSFTDFIIEKPRLALYCDGRAIGLGDVLPSVYVVTDRAGDGE